MNILKIDSEVVTDDDKEEFPSLLKTSQTTSDQKATTPITTVSSKTKSIIFYKTIRTIPHFLPARIPEAAFYLQ